MRYSELRPAQLDDLWKQEAPAIVPIGALEWHGPHLPLGLDGIIAEWFAERLAERAAGVLLPTFWTPVTTLPHHHSLQVSTVGFRILIDDTIAGLYRSGARTVCIITGHYAQGHEIELYEAAMRAMDEHQGLRVLAATPLEVLGESSLMDHAGRYETSQLLALRPDLVKLDELPESLHAKQVAVLGTDPRLGSSEEGLKLLDRGMHAWQDWIENSTVHSLNQHYQQAFDRYQPYVDAYGQGTWEEGIARWWSER